MYTATTPSGMPARAPTRSPIPHAPKAQPRSAPTPIAAASAPIRSPEALASECGEEAASGVILPGAYHRVCNSLFVVVEPNVAMFVTCLGCTDGAARPRPRQRDR